MEGENLPTMLSVPPSSLNMAKKFFLQLASKRVYYWQCVVALGLAKKKNEGVPEFSQITFRMEAKLEGDLAMRSDAYHKAIAPFLDAIRVSGDDFTQSGGE